MFYLFVVVCVCIGLFCLLCVLFCVLMFVMFFVVCVMLIYFDFVVFVFDLYNLVVVQLFDDISWEFISWVNVDGMLCVILYGDNGELIKFVLLIDLGIWCVSGFFGCNCYMGIYVIKNGVLSFGLFVGMWMVCLNMFGGQFEVVYFDVFVYVEKIGVQMCVFQ